MPRVTSFEIPKLGHDDIYSSADEASGILGLIRFVVHRTNSHQLGVALALFVGGSAERWTQALSHEHGTGASHTTGCNYGIRTECLGVVRCKWYYGYSVLLLQQSFHKDLPGSR